MALRIKGPLSEAVPQETEMADQKNAPSNGLVRYPDGKARRIGAGDPIPKGATFEGPGGKGEQRGPSENTKGRGPREQAGTRSTTTTPAPTPTTTTTPAPS